MLNSLRFRIATLIDFLVNRNRYKIRQLIQEKGNLTTEQWMKRDWDARAEANPKFFSRLVANQTDKEFWQSGRISRDQILGRPIRGNVGRDSDLHRRRRSDRRWSEW